MDRHRIEVRPDRLVMEYRVDPDQTMDMWNHVAQLRDEGWRMLSVDSHVPAYERGWFREAASPAELTFTILFEKVEPLA